MADLKRASARAVGRAASQAPPRPLVLAWRQFKLATRVHTRMPLNRTESGSVRATTGRRQHLVPSWITATQLAARSDSESAAPRRSSLSGATQWHWQTRRDSRGSESLRLAVISRDSNFCTREPASHLRHIISLPPICSPRATRRSSHGPRHATERPAACYTERPAACYLNSASQSNRRALQNLDAPFVLLRSGA